MLTRPHAPVLAALLCTLCACSPTSLLGEPCTDAGEDVCEGDVLLRCDGTVYVKITDCASSCVEDKEEVKHSEPISADETWACADGPHLVEDTLTITSGTTLTLTAGALVRIVAAARINTELSGRIDALGTAQAPILITSKSGDASGFGGGTEGGLNVFAVATGEPSVIEHTIIERGTHGLGVFNLSSTATPPVVRNNTFRDNTNYGINILCAEDAPPIPDFAADGNSFFNNGAGEVSGCAP